MTKQQLEGLDDLAKTLLLTLYARAVESQRPDAIVRDDKAVAMVKAIDFDFSQARLQPHDEVAVILRMREFDRQTREFLSRDPQGIVVHLGCGLDTRFERVDNGSVDWYDLDLPPVVQLRRRLLGDEGPRYHLLAASVLDPTWMMALDSKPGTSFLFLAEGLLPYFRAEEVMSLVLRLLHRFPGSELVCDAHTPFVLWADNLQLSFTRIKARLHWSLRRGSDMEAWADGIRLLEEWFYFDDPEPRLRAFQWARHFPEISKSSGVFHYQLGNAQI